MVLNGCVESASSVKRRGKGVCRRCGRNAVTVEYEACVVQHVWSKKVLVVDVAVKSACPAAFT